MSRQVGEAVWILYSGNLNSRSEFGLNHLCRLVSQKSPADEEEDSRIQEQNRARERADAIQFCNVMKNVEELCKIDRNDGADDINPETNCRYKNKKRISEKIAGQALLQGRK